MFSYSQLQGKISLHMAYVKGTKYFNYFVSVKVQLAQAENKIIWGFFSSWLKAHG